MPTDYNEKYLNILKEIVLSIIEPREVMVFLFGSRAIGEYTKGADADIGLLSDKKIPTKLYHQIRNAIDESIVPWKVDIVDFTRVEPAFKEHALKKIIIWNKPATLKNADIN